ncbi:hypothetical protein KC19_1G129700 [Ceratodon purpureus]|uniref:Amino acid transporter transmembrane domain-containing protein n=1 Tax=Ceratodon purpureus TaxID=3225 RepID=A0A8T0J7T9_CERPU|nr:hypothetical protein KC19_1G129700 [Ceratodon purpureus]
MGPQNHLFLHYFYTFYGINHLCRGVFKQPLLCKSTSEQEGVDVHCGRGIVSSCLSSRLWSLPLRCLHWRHYHHHHIYLLARRCALLWTGVKHTGANDMVEFFSGVGNILGAYGGHGITIEILETMKRPSAYKYVNLAVFFYALLVTIPSSVAVYWSAGDILLKQSNAFAVLPGSGWQTLAIATIIAHQAMGFILFTHPIFLLCEKAAGVHTRRFFLRVLCRIPVVAIMFFFALAVPFFGPINSLLGSFGVGLGMYLIPAVVFLVTYRTKSARENSPVKPPWFLPTWSLVFVVNVVVILWTLVVGVGLGGWAGISNLIRQVHSFGFFDKCFQCPPKPK